MHTSSSYEPGLKTRKLSHNATHFPQVTGRGAEPSYDSGWAQQPGQQPQLPQNSPSYFASNIQYQTPPPTSHNNILLGSAGVRAGYGQDGLSSEPPLTWGASYEIGGFQSNVYQHGPGGSFPNLRPQPPQHFSVHPSIPPLAGSGGGAEYHGRFDRINLLSEGGVAPGGQGYSPQTGVHGPSQYGGQASSDFNYSTHRHGFTAPAITNASLQDQRNPALMSAGASGRKGEHVPRGGGSQQGGGMNWAGSDGGSWAGGGGGENQQDWAGGRGDSERASAHSGAGCYSGRGGGGRSDTRRTAGDERNWGSSAGGLGGRGDGGRGTPSGGMPPRPPPPRAPPGGRSQTGSGDEGPDWLKDLAAEVAALRLDSKTAAETAARVAIETKAKFTSIEETADSKLATVKSDLEAKVFTLESGLAFLKQTVNRGLDPIVIRHLLNEVKIVIHKVTDRTYSPPVVVHVDIHSKAQNALNRGQLEFLTQECLEEVYGNEPDSSRGQGDTAAHSGSTQDLRNAILRLASKPKYYALRLLYRYKYRKSVGTATAALLSYSPGEQLAADLMLSLAATAAEAVAVKAEAEIFRIHPEWRL